MRRAYALAIAAISVYCLTDAFASSGGERSGRAGVPVFSAEIVDAPIVDPREPGVTSDVLAQTPSATSHDAEVAAANDVNSSPAKHTASPALAAAAAPAPAKVHMAALAPRMPTRHMARAETVVQPKEIPAPAPVAPTWQPPVQRVAVVQRSTVAGCSGGKWSQPDAAGVPVLLCD